MSVQLFHGDCLDVIRTLPPVDVVVTDPPYGIGIGKSKRLVLEKGWKQESWDNERALLEVAELVKIYCDKKIIIWGGNYYTDVLPPQRGWLAWDKINDGRDFGELELAWTNIDTVIRRYKKFPVRMDGGKVHPTQKPIELMKWCVEKVSSPGDTILDPFMGSGTTGVACVQLGRNFIGIEKNAEYFAIAKKRIEAAQLQIPMFTAPAPTAEQVALIG